MNFRVAFLASITSSEFYLRQDHTNTTNLNVQFLVQ